MEELKNKNLAQILRKAAEADGLSVQAHKVANQTASIAGELNSLFHGIRAELKTIEAKKTLKIRLTARERALWTLYGTKE